MVKKILAISVFLLLFADGAWAQACGRGFASVSAYDSKLRPIKKFEIEFLGAFKGKIADELGFADPAFTDNKVIQIPGREAKELIKKTMPPEMPEPCGNPLKQVTGMKIKWVNFAEQTDVLGFCTTEVFLQPALLRIRADGYRPMYLVGVFLGGCSYNYQFVMSDKKEPKIRTRKALPGRFPLLNR